MDQYPPNSHKARAPKQEPPEPKKVDKVVTGDVSRRKKPLSKRFIEVFVGGDSRGVATYVLLDVLVPAAKDAVSDSISEGINRLLYGESRPGGRRGGVGRYGTPGNYTNYNKAFKPPHDRDEPRNVSRRSRTVHDFDEIILATRVEAEEVIDRMFDLLSRYQVVTVADLYDLVGVTSNHTDTKWGWTELRGSGVSRARNRYLLDVPRPELLD